MRHSTLFAGVSVSLLLAGAALPAFAQTATETTRETTRYTMPNQAGFWNYAGIAGGATKFKEDCVSGFNCDDKGTGLKVYAGGKFANWLGLEIGYIDLGKGQFGGGDTKARGLNISAVFSLPVGQYSDLHARAGSTYAQARVTGTAPGFSTGTDTGWRASGGVGTAIGLNRNWAVTVDWDRYNVEFPSSRKDHIDMLSAGVQYRY